MIGIVHTGGTIGSTAGDTYISTDCKKLAGLLQTYHERGGRKQDFVICTPYELLSENMSCREYPILADAVKSMMDRGAEGVIVTHGSDTIQYSAAFLSYVLGDSCPPVLLVCSNYVLEDARANGADNFACAVDFIEKSCGKGVYVPYRGKDGVTRVFYGNCILPHDIYSDELRGMKGIYYGDYAEGSFVPSGMELPGEKVKYDIPEKCGMTSDILVIHPYPGMKYPSLKGYRAVLHCSYHSGTLCTAGEEFEHMTEEAGKMGIPVYLTGTDDEKDYESTEAFEKKGIIKLKNIAEPAAYILIWLEINVNN